MVYVREYSSMVALVELTWGTTRSEMTLNLWMIADIHPNRMEWLAIRFLIVKSFLHLTEKLVR